jgi:hypothetical protein
VVGFLGGAVVLAAFTAGTGTLALVWHLYQYRGCAGADWFVMTLAARALWAFSHGAGLLVFDRALRAYAEAVSLVGLLWLGPLFLGSALPSRGRPSSTASRPPAARRRESRRPGRARRP